MKKTMKTLLYLMIPGALLVSSCKKDHTDVKPYTNHKSDSIQFYLSVDNDINSIDQVIEEIQEDEGIFRRAGSCYSVSFTKDTNAPVPGFEVNYRKYVVTFTGTCDSLNRTGQIIVFKSGSWLTGNYKDSTIFSGFFTDGRGITGYKTRSLSTSSDLKDLVFNYSNHLEVATKNNGTISFQSQGKRVIVNYLLPLLRSVEISGDGKIVNASGEQVSYAITKTVVLNGSCQRKFRFPVQGTITYTNTAANSTSTIDYGNGTCDRLATISVNNAAPVTFYLR